MYCLDRCRYAQFEAAISGGTHTSDPIEIPAPSVPSAPIEIFSPPKSTWRKRLVQIGVRTLIVGVLTGIGSQIGGWAGGIVTAVLSSIAAVLVNDNLTHHAGETGHG